MRLLTESIRSEARRQLAATNPSERVASPLTGLRSYKIWGSLLIGAALGFAFGVLVLPEPTGPAYLLCVLGGAGALYLLIAVPGLVWSTWQRQWAGWLIAQGERKATELLGRGDALLREEEGEKPPAWQMDNDLAVAVCLQAGAEQAVGEFQRLYEERPDPVTANNLALALARADRWSDLADLRRRAEQAGLTLDEVSLALAAAEAPEGGVLEELSNWAKDKSSQLVLNNLGVRALRAGDLPRAGELLRAALARRQAYMPAHLNLGVVAFWGGNHPLALSETALAGGVAPGDPAVCNNLGALLCQLGDPRVATQWLKRAAVAEPLAVEIAVNGANAAALQGNYQPALQSYLHTTQMAKCAAAHHNAALVMVATGQQETAREQQRLAHELSPDDPEIVNNWGCLAWQAGEHEEAASCFREAAQRAASPVFLGNIVLVELLAGRVEEAQRLMEANPDSSSDGVFARALLYLITATQIRPELSPTHLDRFQFNLDHATAEFNRIIESGRGLVAEALMNRGAAAYLNQNFEGAADSFAGAAGMMSEDRELVYPVAVCYLMAAERKQREHGRGEPLSGAARELLLKARPYLERAAEVRELAQIATYNLGVLFYLLGEYQKTIDLLRIAAGPDATPELLNLLAIAYARRVQELNMIIRMGSLVADTKKRQMAAEVSRMLTSAIGYFTRVLGMKPDSPVVHANMGLAYMLRNRGSDVETALAHWQRMRQADRKWGDRIYVLFSDAVAKQETWRLAFQDVEVSVQPLQVQEWIAYGPSRMAGLKYLLQERLERPDGRLQAYTPLIRRALAYHDRSARLRERLRQIRIVA